MDDPIPKQPGPQAPEALASHVVDRWLSIRLREGYDTVLRQPPPEDLLALLRDDRSGRRG